MSNLAMANLNTAAAPRQPETATGKTAVAKKDSTFSNTSQVDVKQDITTNKETVDGSVLTSKTNKKFSFNDLLQKRLPHNDSNDKSDNSQSAKQSVVNTEFTSENKKTVSAEKEKKDTTSPLLSAMLITPQFLDGSKKQAVLAGTNSKSLHNVHINAIRSTKTGAMENTKTVAVKESAAIKSTAKETKPLSSVEKKEFKGTANEERFAIKQVSGQANEIENKIKKGVSETNPNVSQQKQDSAHTTINLSVGLTAASKDKSQPNYSQTQVHTSIEDRKTDKNKLAPLKNQEKAKVVTTPETSEIAQTVISSRQAEMVTPGLARQVGTESVSVKEVTIKSTMKSDIGQAVTPSEQIIDKVKNTITGSTQQIQVTLNPAELGMVRITFRQQDGQIEGLMEVQDTEVRKDVEKALPQIVAALAQNGVQVRRMDIAPMQNQQSNQESFQSPEHEFNPADQHYLGEKGNSGENGKTGDRIAGQDVQLANGLGDMAQQAFSLSGLNMYA